MKFRHLFFILLAFSFFACEEIPPVVTGSMGGPTGGPTPPPDLESQERQVLIEEFTGVRCVQCPAGSALLQDLLAQNGIQLVAVSIHASDFDVPYNDSQYDFRTPEGTEIINFLGSPIGYPSAVVNRKKFDGEPDLQLFDPQWAGFINEEKAIPPKVKIGIEPTFDAATRDLDMNIQILVEETLTEEARLSIMFTESGMMDLQKVPTLSEPDPNYVHKLALRDMATNATGDAIPEALTAGTFLEKEYSFSVPEEWKEDKCHIVAFIHLAGGDTKEVLQAVQVDMVQ